MESLFGGAFVGAFALLVGLEGLRPARRLPAVRLWRASGVAAFAVSFAVAGMVSALLTRPLTAHRLIDAESLGVAGGAVVGFLFLELVRYWWHRATHRVPLLWRWHQLHHSAERIDMYGAMWFHPVDAALSSLVGCAALALVLGVRIEAALIASGVSSILSLFQHANLATPRWLGWIVQRPESHSVHHERGVHHFNCSNLPLWDIAFDTFRNPPSWRCWSGREAGFHDGASRRIVPMLLGRDVGVADRAPPRSRGSMLQ